MLTLAVLTCSAVQEQSSSQRARALQALGVLVPMLGGREADFDHFWLFKVAWGDEFVPLELPEHQDLAVRAPQAWRTAWWCPLLLVFCGLLQYRLGALLRPDRLMPVQRQLCSL